MEGAKPFSPLVEYVAEITAPGAFTLVDIGCSGGIDRFWRKLGRRLRAIGIDPNVQEIERLRAAERNPAIEYVNAFAGLPKEHPFALRKGSSPDFGRSPLDRLSAWKFLELTAGRSSELTAAEKLADNLWPSVPLSERTVIVPDLLRERAVSSVDFLKIDVDGKDFEVLNSFDEALDRLQVLAVGMEVNYFGSDSDTDHTFHNTDRFLKARGFEVFNLTVRRYSATSLPARFVSNKAGPTESGRVLSGDALYVRDLASGYYDDFAARLSPEKILNVALIFSVFQLPDCAAEVLVKFRPGLSQLCDVDRALDLLAAQAQNRSSGASYREHVENFQRDPQSFLAPRNPFLRDVLSTMRHWKKGYLIWKGRRKIEQ
jgi:FkbM family methyltransferase